jgi:hypothetical protein
LATYFQSRRVDSKYHSWIERYLDEDNTMNPIFWKNETLKKCHDFGLSDFENWNLEKEQKTVIYRVYYFQISIYQHLTKLFI